MPAEPAAKAIIFDVEGTLIDCARETIACWHETLASFGIDAAADTLTYAAPRTKAGPRPRWSRALSSQPIGQAMEIASAISLANHNVQARRGLLGSHHSRDKNTCKGSLPQPSSWYSNTDTETRITNITGSHTTTHGGAIPATPI